MNDALQKKLLLFRAGQYAGSIRGTRSFSVSKLLAGEFLWHREVFSRTILIDSPLEGRKFAQPVVQTVLLDAIANAIGTDAEFDCYEIFEGLAAIQFRIQDIKAFCSSKFALQQTYDLFLAFTVPDRVLVIHDGEESLELHNIERVGDKYLTRSIA